VRVRTNEQGDLTLSRRPRKACAIVWIYFFPCQSPCWNLVGNVVMLGDGVLKKD
jgi:hypothetical protein